MDYKAKSEKHSLGQKAEKAGWTRLGRVRQDTRWLPPTGANVSKPHVYEEEYDIKRFMRDRLIFISKIQYWERGAMLS